VLKNDIINVESLLKNKKNNVNYRNKDGQTALHYAALYNYDKLAEILLDNNTDINSADNLGRTPLHLAAQNDSCQAAASLILHGAHAALKDNDDKIALDYAKSSEMKNIVAI
jgi:ankyrin repeat protein